VDLGSIQNQEPAKEENIRKLKQRTEFSNNFSPRQSKLAWKKKRKERTDFFHLLMTVLRNFLLGRVSISCQQHQLPFLASFLNPEFTSNVSDKRNWNQVIWRVIILPITAEDVRPPGGFNFTHSSTISFHFLTKQNPNQQLFNSLFQHSVHIFHNFFGSSKPD
jgi:hypothetical protein